MLKRRLIPVLYLRKGVMVRSELFKFHQIIGSPISHINRLVEWDVDELILLDISPGLETYDLGRDDHGEKGAGSLLEFTETIAKTSAIPLCFGGRIRSIDDIHIRIRHGADKVAINSAFAQTPDMVSEAAREFGAQAIVISIDYRIVEASARVFVQHGAVDTGIDAMTWARRAEDAGAGEILLNAIDRDGRARGYDIETIEAVSQSVEIPVIACGGAGHQSHFDECFEMTSASAVAAGNIFHFTENAYPRAKSYLRRKRSDIR